MQRGLGAFYIGKTLHLNETIANQHYDTRSYTKKEMRKCNLLFLAEKVGDKFRKCSGNMGYQISYKIN